MSYDTFWLVTVAGYAALLGVYFKVVRRYLK
jgi:hypothetical protein